MNRCGSFGGGGATHEVEPDRWRLAGVDFLGAMEVDLGMQIYKNNKRQRKRKERQPKVVWGGNEQPCAYFKGSKYSLLCCGEGLYAEAKRVY